MDGDPNNEDDTFSVQATKEVWFMNRDLEARGFEYQVEHHNIEHVASSEDHIHTSFVVLVLEDDCVDGQKTYPSTIRKRTDPTPFSPRDSQGSCQSAEQGDYKRSIYLHTLTTQTSNYD
jgi:hypothetical protein